MSVPTLPDPVRGAALAAPDRLAVVAPDGVLTWAELDRQVEGCAARLGRLDGAVVGIQGPAGVGFVAWLFGIARAGGIAAPGQVGQVTVTTADLPESRVPEAERFWALDEVRLQVATSGSTGVPKQVPITTGQLVFSAFGSMLRLGHLPADRWLACLPLVHVGGLAILFRAAFAADTIEVLPFDAAAVATRLDSGEVQLVSLTPTMLADVLDARTPAPFPASLRAVLVGGASCPPALLERCRALGVPAALTWGLTEAASQVCTRWPGDLDPDHGAGPPLAFARVEVQGEALAVRGPVVAQGLEITNDFGAVIDGRLHVAGRLDAVINSGGVKLDGTAIERALRSHPAVQDVVVVALPDPRFGERPGALLVPAGADRPDDALRALCRSQVGRFAAPDRLLWCADLPRTGPLAKVDRGAVRRHLMEANHV